MKSLISRPLFELKAFSVRNSNHHVSFKHSFLAFIRHLRSKNIQIAGFMIVSPTFYEREATILDFRMVSDIFFQLLFTVRDTYHYYRAGNLKLFHT